MGANSDSVEVRTELNGKLNGYVCVGRASLSIGVGCLRVQGGNHDA